MDTKGTKTSKTKQKIIQCFWLLFRQKSIDKITVSELTTLAQINRSTFYAHFKDVYDVLDKIEESYLPDGEKFFQQCHEKSDRELFYQTFLRIFDQRYENFSFLLSDQGDPNFIIKLKNRTRPFFKASIPDIYQDSKYFDLTIEFVLSATIHVITYWANHPSEISSDELFNHLHDLFIYGIPHTMGLDVKK